MFTFVVLRKEDIIFPEWWWTALILDTSTGKALLDLQTWSHGPIGNSLFQNAASACWCHLLLAARESQFTVCSAEEMFRRVVACKSLQESKCSLWFVSLNVQYILVLVLSFYIKYCIFNRRQVPSIYWVLNLCTYLQHSVLCKHYEPVFLYILLGKNLFILNRWCSIGYLSMQACFYYIGSKIIVVLKIEAVAN